MLMRLLPLVMLAGSLGFIVVLGVRNPTSWLFGGMFAISTLGMMATGGGRAGVRRGRPPSTRGAATTCATSARCARTVQEAAAAQRASAEAAHPEPEAWPAVVAGGRLWERSTADADFGARAHRPRRPAPRHPPHPAGVRAARGVGAGHRARVAPVPEGAHRGAGAAGRAVAAGDGHDLARTRRRSRPRAGQSRRRAVRAVAQPGRCAGRRRRRTVGVGRVGVGQVAAAQRPPAAPRRGGPAADVHRRGRRRCAAGGRTRPPGRTCSSSSTGWPTGMGPWAVAPCVTVLRVGAPAGRRPTPSVVRLRLTGEGVERVLDGEPPVAIGVPDRLATAQAAALARRLARYRPGGDLRRSRRARCARVARPGGPAAGARGDRRAARAMGGRRGRPAARAHRRRRARGSGTARPQGVRPGRQRAARALHRGHRFRQERAAAHPRRRAGRHARARGAELRAHRLQGRRNVPRPRGACRTSRR